ncbi:hypothetical protein [Streptomyces sp. NPDC046805]|uniref:hypothetical protein n=1 Tax=Streptomyces sp. NPDC046805 TaxID=3155134 RepID=UPI003400BE51
MKGIARMRTRAAGRALLGLAVAGAVAAGLAAATHVVPGDAPRDGHMVAGEHNWGIAPVHLRSGVEASSDEAGPAGKVEPQSASWPPVG